MPFQVTDGNLYEQHLVGLGLNGSFKAIDGYLGGMQSMGHIHHTPGLAGSLYPQWSAHTGSRPGCTFTSLDVRRCLDAAELGLTIANAHLITTGNEFQSFWVKKAAIGPTAGGYDPTNSRVFRIKEGFIAMDSIVVAQNGLAAVGLSAIAAMAHNNVYSTAAEAPVSFESGVALPAIDPMTRVWTMGPVTLERGSAPADFADLMQLVGGWQFAPGPTVVGGMTLGDPFPRLGAMHWSAGTPTVMINLRKPTALHDLGLVGLEDWGRTGTPPAGDETYKLTLTLTSVDVGEAGRVAGTTAEHIKLTFWEGSLKCSPIQSDPQVMLTDSLLFEVYSPTDGSNTQPVTIETNATIPGVGIPP